MRPGAHAGINSVPGFAGAAELLLASMRPGAHAGINSVLGDMETIDVQLLQ